MIKKDEFDRFMSSLENQFTKRFSSPQKKDKIPSKSKETTPPKPIWRSYQVKKLKSIRKFHTKKVDYYKNCLSKGKIPQFGKIRVFSPSKNKIKKVITQKSHKNTITVPLITINDIEPAVELD
ncbi:unnamed protein product [Moneuplotes crassus]|uniref:Uncharacterized protein n=1 Tax=Euplotes crassus TaxID=5936 RepID=A0AAD1YAX1_EUPCR|nr:unnamed protein product [Moneuplotes crassus]